MNRPKLNKLSQEVVNQIAAGEVVERPSSVVKELVDNAIDAEATKIHINIKNGGIDLVEVQDNGYGIPKDNIESVFDTHTTSKLVSIEDLNTLLSMGFRGEALSTIASVAKVSLVSRYIDEEFANEIFFNGKGKSEIRKAAKEQGTTTRVENIFYNIPARRKYLKTAQTEYRKIFELLNSYILIYPNIRFVLEKDGKITEDIQSVSNSLPGEITQDRVNAVLGSTTDFLKLYYDGSGIKINGYLGHPLSHRSKLSKSYIFVNSRPVTDRGIMRAIYEGYSRYLPYGEKIDFVVNIFINPELVDVNVHPRKEEVRFENPFRIYSAVENAVKHTLEKELSFENTSSNNFASIRESFNKESSTSKQYQTDNIYLRNKSASVKDTLLFSKELLSDIQTEELPWEGNEEITNIFQIFNKYIIIEFSDGRLWVVDQHAAAERINFEKLSKRGKEKLEIQNYLVPVEIELKKEEILFLEEYSIFFEEIGILYDIKGNTLILKTVPVEFSTSDFKLVFQDIFSLEEDISILKKNFEKLRDDILATISCHASIRSGKKLQREVMLDLFKKLSKCNNPYSCPHGRPAVWKLTLEEIDNNFERTY